MAENSQQPARSPSQIAAAHKGSVHGHETEPQHGGRSPSAIAAAAHGGVHGPDRGFDLPRSPSQIAAEALRSVVDSTDGYVLHSDGQGGGGPGGKTWTDYIEDRNKNNQGGNGDGQNQRGRGRSLPEEQRQREKEQEKDKGPSRMEQAYERAKEAVHELKHDWECHGY